MKCRICGKDLDLTIEWCTDHEGNLVHVSCFHDAYTVDFDEVKRKIAILPNLSFFSLVEWKNKFPQLITLIK